MENREVDVRGLVCPAPVIEITKASRDLSRECILTVVMDENGKTNVEGWARGNDFKITDFKKEAGKVIFTLRKNG